MKITNKRLYRIFHNMKSRCYLKTFPKYKYYGARGIGICNEWSGKNGYYSFEKWALENGYNDKLEIDRIDNEKDYSPNNCRWVDRKTQNNNTRKNKFITYNNETKTVAQWAEIYKMHRCVLNNRISRGMSFEDAITIPVRTFNK